VAKVVSFNRDAPALKPKGLRSWEQMFAMQVSGDYLTFAGQRELRAWLVTASDGASAFVQEFKDKGALCGFLLDVLDYPAETASFFVDKAVRGELVSLNFFLGEDELRQFGFKEPGKPFTPPNLF
jgi:hypothetical protein